MAEAAKPSMRELLAEVADVVHDLPAFMSAPLYRNWHRHWGATPAEIAESLPGDALLWAKPDGTWAWRLTPVEGNGTRLVTRIHAIYDWRHPVSAVFGMLLMEFGDFAMQRRMLRGIKARAESHEAISWSREQAASPVCATP